MSKQYKGSLSLEWYNKKKSILLRETSAPAGKDDIPAPKINWINKDEALFYEIDETEGRGLTPYWVDRNDIRVKETRPLIFKKGYKAVPKGKDIVGKPTGYKVTESDKDDSEIENILIRGDNLLSLNTLKKIFDQKPEEEKVKCIYIDPPYNTGASFEHYDDSLEHSEWLTLMRDRLTLLYSLLGQNGFIFIQIDEKEQAYLKALMDEIFGRKNFINLIAIKSKPSAGASGGGEDKKLKKNIEYLLLYTKSSNYDFSFAAEKTYKSLFDVIQEMREDGKSWKYTSILLNEGDFDYTTTIKDGSGNEIIISKYKNIKRTTINQIVNSKKKDSPKLSKEDSEQDAYLSYFGKIFSDTNAQTSIRTRIIDHVGSLNDDEILIVEYTPVSGKDKGKLVKHYYISNTIRRVIWLKDSAIKKENDILKADTLGTLWEGFNWNNVTKEGQVSFPTGKKPEALLEKIIEIATEPNDIVLDSFAGSGTTAAVAHKLGRRWLSIEIGEHAETHIIVRLKRVLVGENQAEICGNDWQGGGSFKYYNLGPSIIDVDENGKGDFNWSLGHKFIEESLLTSYDYILQKDVKILPTNLFDDDYRPAVGILNIGSKTLAAVCSLNEPDGDRELIDIDEVKTIYKTLKKKFSPEYLTIFTNRGVEMALDSKPDDLEIIKVPHAIFAELEK